MFFQTLLLSLSLSDCFYIRPSGSFYGFSVKTLLSPPTPVDKKEKLMSFQFVSGFLTAWWVKGVCIYSSLSVFLSFPPPPPGVNKHIFALPQRNAIWQWQYVLVWFFFLFLTSWKQKLRSELILCWLFFFFHCSYSSVLQVQHTVRVTSWKLVGF